MVGYRRLPVGPEYQGVQEQGHVTVNCTTLCYGLGYVSCALSLVLLSKGLMASYPTPVQWGSYGTYGLRATAQELESRALRSHSPFRASTVVGPRA